VTGDGSALTTFEATAFDLGLPVSFCQIPTDHAVFHFEDSHAGADLRAGNRPREVGSAALI